MGRLGRVISSCSWYNASVLRSIAPILKPSALQRPSVYSLKTKGVWIPPPVLEFSNSRSTQEIATASSQHGSTAKFIA